MKSVIVALVAAFAGVAVAQINFADLPVCAQGCVGSSINVPGCTSIDVKCICSNKDYLNNLSCCIVKTCQQADQDKAVQFASSLCSSAGVNVPNKAVCSSAASGSSSSATAATESSSASSASSSASSMSSSSSAASASSSSSSTVAAAVGGTTGSPAPAGNGTVTSSTPSASKSSPAAATSNAAAQLGSGLGLAGVAAAVLAFL